MLNGLKSYVFHLPKLFLCVLDIKTFIACSYGRLQFEITKTRSSRIESKGKKHTKQIESI